MYGLKSDEYISRELNRPAASVRKMAEAIFPAITRTGEWREAEVQKMKKYLGICSVEIIARIFGRGVADVQAQIEKLDSYHSDDPWTQEEIADLKRLYGTRADGDVARIFGRSESSVTTKASELCLAKDKAFVRKISGQEVATRMPRWTPQEIEQLEKMYADHSNLEIAQALNRSVKSVVSKAHNIGLKKDSRRLQMMGRQNVSLRYSRQAARKSAAAEQGASASDPTVPGASSESGDDPVEDASDQNLQHDGGGSDENPASPTD